jgi:hypothetical protein
VDPRGWERDPAGLRRLAHPDVSDRLERGQVRVSEDGDGLAAVGPSINRVLFRVG